MTQTASVQLEEKARELSSSESFLQTSFWAEFKSLHGWNHSQYSITALINGVELSLSCSVLFRTFSSIFTICYIPLGIELGQKCPFSYSSGDYQLLLKEFCSELAKKCPKNTLCIRIDPPISFIKQEDVLTYVSYFEKNYHPLKKAPVNIQPPDTVILDLSLSEDGLLDQMKSKWRYNIRLAEKKGVVVVQDENENIDIFYSLYEQTAKRDGIAIHSKDYYKSLFVLAKKYKDVKVRLYTALHEGDVIASIITLFTKNQGVYVYGASSNEKRNLMSTYLLQWKAICDAKSEGCLSYDFYGIPPTDDEHHPMHGLHRFKTGFGGRIIHRIGSIDYPVSGFYIVYSFAELIRNFWFKKVKKIATDRRS